MMLEMKAALLRVLQITRVGACEILKEPTIFEPVVYKRALFNGCKWLRPNIFLLFYEINSFRLKPSQLM